MAHEMRLLAVALRMALKDPGSVGQQSLANLLGAEPQRSSKSRAA
jgi:hypothetical protein